MIFKNLFASAHNNKDPEIRIASLEKLDPNKEKDKSIIHELAFNDASDKVKIAALKHLDSFVLWVKTAETTHSQMIKKIAQQQCYALIEQREVVDDKLFIAYLTEMKSKSVLQHLLFNSNRLDLDKTLALSLMFKIDSELVVKRYFAEKANAEQQLEIVEKTDDEKLLNRFTKHAKKESVLTAITQKIEHLNWVKLQPAKVKQKAVLINALLLNLKDVDDYDILNNELEQHSKDFEILKKEFGYLNEQDAAELTSKYLSLKNAAQLRLLSLEERHKKALEAKQIDNDIAKLRANCDQISEQIEFCISQEESDVNSQVKIFDRALNTAVEEISNILGLHISANQVSVLSTVSKKIDDIRFILKHLLESKALVSENVKATANAKALLDDYEEKTVADTEYTDSIESNASALATLQKEFAHIQSVFNTNMASAHISMPAEVKQGFSKQEHRFRGILHKINADTKQLERKLEQKLNVVKHLIKDGKFKSAISTFHHVKLLISKVSDENLARTRFKRIVKLYESTAQEVEKLQDWQAYLAQPRKPELLSQAKALVASEFSDGYERAESVKKMRQEWNSFGQLYTQEDDQLNAEFDTTLEQAFAPCRDFFAQIDKVRSDNAEQAKSIIKETKELDVAELDIPLVKKISQLRQAFTAIGELDRKDANKLKREFNKVLRPLSIALDKEQENNATQKNELLKHASRLNSLDDLEQAVNEAKKLQQKWKAIGFAGKKQDNQLWHAFREKNDAIFNKYHQAVSEKHAKQNEALQAVEQEISAIAVKLKKSRTSSDLEFFEQSFGELETHSRTLDENLQKKISSKVQGLSRSFEATVKKFNRETEELQIQSLFLFLNSDDKESSENKGASLPNKYRSWLSGDFDKHVLLAKYDRQSLVVVLSLIEDKPLDSEGVDIAPLKKQIQLDLMAAKLQGESMPLKEDILKHWVGQGKLNKADKKLLPNLESFYRSESKEVGKSKDIGEAEANIND